MFRVKVLFVFVLGFAAGAVLAAMLFLSGDVRPPPPRHRDHALALEEEEDVVVVLGPSVRPAERSRDSNVNRNEEEDGEDKEGEGAEGQAKVRIVCAIFASDLSNSFAAADTWARHCDAHRFYGKAGGGSDFYKYLDVTAIRAKHSWHFLCDAIRHLHAAYDDDALHWAFFAPDDVFAIPENLRHYVRRKDHNKPYYLGDISCFWFTYYNTAQAGYVLSRGAIRLLVAKFNTTESCVASGKHWKNEDYYLGKHLFALGVRPEDTRDRRGRGRFHAFSPEQLYAPDDGSLLTKYFKRRIHPNSQGVNCCNEKSITFHGSFQDRIFFYYYLLYRVRPYVSAGSCPNNLSNTYVETPQVWQRFVRDELGERADVAGVDAEEYYRLWARKVTPEELVSRLRQESAGAKLKGSSVSAKRKA